MATSPPSRQPDLLVIGGGVVGLAVARAWSHRNPSDRIVVLEKEGAPGLHASGRNSGVLHAGFYYEPGSLKARLTREGNRRWKEFCRERGLPLRETGKLLLPTRPSELDAFPLLLVRARENEVPLREITAAEAREIEPRALGLARALYSPETAVVDPGATVAALARDTEARGVEVLWGVRFVGNRGGRGDSRPSVRLSDGRTVTPGFIVNAAGLQADQVARAFGYSRHHRILPFRGSYLLSANGDRPVGCCLYPVPDLSVPFLGIHLTPTAEGGEKIGPSARPALWREHYGGLRGFRPGETAEIGWRQLRLLARNAFGFRFLAREAIRTGRRRVMVERAAGLAMGVKEEDYRRWGRPGIRAQLVNTRESRLEMDFRVEGDERSLHILNAVSPGFTCALPFGELLVDRVLEGRAMAGPDASDAAGT